MKVDQSKVYKTQAGKEVRLYATASGGLRPVHGAVLDGDIWTAFSWCADGKWYDTSTSPWDLIEVKPIREEWLNIFRSGGSSRHNSPKSADICYGLVDDRIACVKITYTEGQFDK